MAQTEQDQTEQIKETLLRRERELEASLDRQDRNSRDTGDADVQDEIDRVTSAEAKTTALDLSTREFQSLRDVRDALSRLDRGEYGSCVVCGNPIEPARIAAIPETPFCLQHADTERAAAAGAGSVLTS